jgi:hypothetical protein
MWFKQAISFTVVDASVVYPKSVFSDPDECMVGEWPSDPVAYSGLILCWNYGVYHVLLNKDRCDKRLI